MMRIRTRKGSPLNYKGDLLVVGHFADIRPLTGAAAAMDWRLNASMSALWKAKSDLLDFGTLTLFPSQQKTKFDGVLLVGLGPKEEFTRDLRREAYRLAVTSASGIGIRALAAEGFTVPDGGEDDMMEDFRRALEDGSLSIQEASLFPGEDFSREGTGEEGSART